MSKLLILCALEDELPPEHNPYKDITVYTGIGKVNATLQAAKIAYGDSPPERIINFGTAGACNQNISGLVECGIFVDRDDSSRFNEEALITNPSLLRLSTGDGFVTSTVKECDVVDMEAYAIAKVCHMNGIYFQCFKYISDYVNTNSYSDWRKNVARGYPLFLEKVNDHFKNTI
jgi:adenosylhomocysteine nucleosidase